MILVPLIRTTRAISASYIYPQHPIIAVGISEIVSVFGPFLNPKLLSKSLSTFICILYLPQFTSAYLKLYTESEKIYYQTELMFLMLFIITEYLYNY